MHLLAAGWPFVEEVPMTEGVIAAIDPKRYREVLGHYPTGVVVVTGRSPDGFPLGMVVGTFSSVSIDPPLVSFMPTKKSETYAALRRASAYCINVLAHDQIDLGRILSQRDSRKFDQVSWKAAESGVPVLMDAVAHIHCRPAQEVEAGDHFIVLCKVEDVVVVRPVSPLVFFQGEYGGFTCDAFSERSDLDVIAAVRVAELARPEVEQLAERFSCEAAVLAQVNDRELTTAVSVYRGRRRIDARVGERIPLIPPLCEANVAWNDEDAQRWMTRLPKDADMTEMCRDRLAAVRQHGYGIARVPEGGWDRYAELNAMVREYAANVMTPARRRELTAALVDMWQYFASFAPHDDETCDIGALTVPVHDPYADPSIGVVPMVLRLSELPRGVTGAQVRDWVAALQDSAARVAAELAGRGKPVLDVYRSAAMYTMRQH
ncbi:flavin reductase [Mycolicibacterium litorale]|uniref:flavin reductase n=1 Tax=Mycolicibacterium litorale TaxID=758802 RepID=UPI003CEDE53C